MRRPGEFNLFLLVMCLVALPFYLAGAVIGFLLPGPEVSVSLNRPPKKYLPSPPSVCPCCGSSLSGEN